MKEKHPTRLDITQTTLSVLFIGLLLLASFWIISPFLIALLWASIIIVATWPALMKFQALLGGRRGIAVAAMTVSILLIIIVPVTFAITTLVHNANHISLQVRSLESLALPPAPDWLTNIPFAGEQIADRWETLASLTPEERAAKLTPYARTALQWFASKAGNIGTIILQFVLTTILAAILFAKGETARNGILAFARRLGGHKGEEVVVLAAKAVRGVVLGVVLTALIQATVGGIGLFLAGVPAAAFLTAVMIILCLAQLGPFLVLIPAVIWLYWSGSPGLGTVLLIITIIAGTIDNIVRPILIRNGADLPLLLIFAGVIGGLLAFGVVGLFVGPVILAVTYTLLKEWVDGASEEATGPGTE
jgi:predicted PurR-regulated permease PerM